MRISDWSSDVCSSDLLGVTALLAACGQKTESNETTAANSATEAASNKGEMSGDMGNMAMPADSAAKMAKGNGTVTAIDKAAGTVTLDHGPIPEANWPAMTMAFKAKPGLLDSIQVGDQTGRAACRERVCQYV